jgi:hypothetical protein
VYPEQSVSEMVEEVLERQAKTLAARTGKPLKRAKSATLKSRAARHLKELAQSPYSEQKATQWQVGLPWARAQERHYSWLESYMEWLEGREPRAQCHALLEEELASLRG